MLKISILLCFLYLVRCEYTAAVVEYSPVIHQGNATVKEAQKIMLQNLEYYEVNELNLL